MVDAPCVDPREAGQAGDGDSRSAALGGLSHCPPVGTAYRGPGLAVRLLVGAWAELRLRRASSQPLMSGSGGLWVIGWGV